MAFPTTLQLVARGVDWDSLWAGNVGTVQVLDGAYCSCSPWTEQVGVSDKLPFDHFVAGDSLFLVLTNFGFAVPSDATVDSVTLDVQRKADAVPAAGTHVQDSVVKLWSAGSAVGSNKAATGVNWPTAVANRNYGGDSTYWGCPLTPALVNNSGFGIGVAIKGTGGPVDFPFAGNPPDSGYIDRVLVTVAFTPFVPPGGDGIDPNTYYRDGGTRHGFIVPPSGPPDFNPPHVTDPPTGIGLPPWTGGIVGWPDDGDS